LNFNTTGTTWLLEFTLFHLAALTAYRLLMTWVYANRCSLFLAVLMHASYTGWLLVLNLATSFEESLIGKAASAVAFLLVVAWPCWAWWIESRGPLRRRYASSQSTDYQMRPRADAVDQARVETYDGAGASLPTGQHSNSSCWYSRISFRSG